MLNKTTKRHNHSIGLVFSDRISLWALLAFVPNRKKVRIESHRVYYFQLNGYDFFALPLESGHERIVQACNLLIKKISPELIISVGTAAAADGDMTTGDVLYANSVTSLQNHVFDQYKILSSIRQDIHRFVIDIVFGYKERTFVGTIVSIADQESLQSYDRFQFRHPVADKEMLPVSEATSRNGITTLALRGITHNLSDDELSSLNTLFDFSWYFNKQLVILQLLSHPGKLFKLISYLKNKIKASTQVASTLFSLISVLSIDINNSGRDGDYKI